MQFHAQIHVLPRRRVGGPRRRRTGGGRRRSPGASGSRRGPRFGDTGTHAAHCLLVTREWRNGRRAGFRCQCPKGRGGSNPPSRTTVGIPHDPGRVARRESDHPAAVMSRPGPWPAPSAACASCPESEPPDAGVPALTPSPGPAISTRAARVMVVGQASRLRRTGTPPGRAPTHSSRDAATAAQAQPDADEGMRTRDTNDRTGHLIAAMTGRMPTLRRVMDGASRQAVVRPLASPGPSRPATGSPRHRDRPARRPFPPLRPHGPH